jgi:hypothetical protein
MRALPQLLGALDDSHLVNRQFAAVGVQRMLDLRLADHGYRFYQGGEDRRNAISRLSVRYVQKK